MLEKPDEEIYDVIRDFGSRNKIFNVHFRNITGGFLNFVETFIDDGDVDMYRAAQVYKEVGYPYMDLVDSWLAERLTIAERVEKGELSEDKGDQQINELNRRIHTEAQQRRTGTQ
jgi:hypothetical protein